MVERTQVVDVPQRLKGNRGLVVVLGERLEGFGLRSRQKAEQSGRAVRIGVPFGEVDVSGLPAVGNRMAPQAHRHDGRAVLVGEEGLMHIALEGGGYGVHHPRPGFVVVSLVIRTERRFMGEAAHVRAGGREDDVELVPGAVPHRGKLFRL